MATKEKIKWVLRMLRGGNKISKLTNDMFEAWMIALEKYNDVTCDSALKIILDEDTKDGYQATTPEFTRICRRVISGQKVTSELSKKADEYSELSKKEAENYHKIIQNFPKPKIKYQRHYDVVEYYNQYGKLKYFMCYEHVDIEKFRESCLFDFSVSPDVVNHVFFSDVKEPVKNDKGETVRLKDTFVKTNNPKGIPVTIGYL